MPCDQILYNSISFEDGIGHFNLVADALREQGYTVSERGDTIHFNKDGISGTYKNGKFDTRQSAYSDATFDVDQVKKSFAGGVVRKAARQYGWKVKSTGNNKFEISKG